MENFENTPTSTPRNVLFIGDSARLAGQLLDLRKRDDYYCKLFIKSREDLCSSAIAMNNARIRYLPHVSDLIKFPVQVLIVALGVYDLESDSSTEEKELAEDLVDELDCLMTEHGITYSIICGVLPRHKESMENYPELQGFNERVLKYNSHLKKLVKNSSRFSFFNFGSLRNIERLIGHDGIDLTDDGLKLFIFYLTQILLEDVPQTIDMDEEEDSTLHIEEDSTLYVEEDSGLHVEGDSSLHKEEEAIHHIEEDTLHIEEDSALYMEEDAVLHVEEDSILHSTKRNKACKSTMNEEYYFFDRNH